MNKPSLASLGNDLLNTTRWERLRCLTLPFLTCWGFFALATQDWWIPAIGCAVVQSFITYASTSHDLVHRNLQLPRWLNEVLLSLIETLSFRSGHAFRKTHLHHHQTFPSKDDLEGGAAHMSFLGALLDGLTAQPRLWLWALRNSRDVDRRWIIAEGFIVLLWALVCMQSLPGVAYLICTITGSWVYPLMTSFMPHDAKASDPLRQTRLFRGRVAAILSWEHLYHLEHHLYPQVPHQRWPELARRLDPFFANQGIKPIILWR